MVGVDCGHNPAHSANFEFVKTGSARRKRERGSMLILAMKAIQKLDECLVQMTIGSDQGVNVPLVAEAGCDGPQDLRR